MRTLYIDVYFLINFTVDVLSLYFACAFSKLPTSSRRLILSALIGAAIAVLVVFIPEILPLKLLFIAIGLLLMGAVAPKPCSLKRKYGFILSFLIFQALTGGVVTMVWGLLDRLSSDMVSDIGGGAVNRKLLLFSIILLLAIGVFKMLVSYFSSNNSDSSVELEICFLNNKKVVCAFVDSGNFAIDPMDMSPVILIKEEFAKTVLPINIVELHNIDLLDREIKKRIRLIPVSRGGVTHVLVGIKADSVNVISEGKREEIRATIAIDKEGGTFGGFEALVPSGALDYVD